MAYENNGYVYNLDTIEPVGDKGETGDKGVKGDSGVNGKDEIVANIATPIDDFLSSSNPDVYFLTTTLLGAASTPAGDIRSIGFSFKPEDVVYWRMVSGSPGKFTNPRVVYDETYQQTYFVANWSGITPTSSLAAGHCLFEILVKG